MKTEVISENQKSINKKDAKILLKGLIQMTKDTFYQDHDKDDFDYEVEKDKMESYCEGLEDAIKKLDTLHTGYTEVTTDENKNYYVTFGSDERFPYPNKYLVISAPSMTDAQQLFRQFFPDRHEKILNYSFMYEEEEWRQVFGYRTDCAGSIELLSNGMVTVQTIDVYTTQPYRNPHEFARESSGRAEQALQLLDDGNVGNGFLGEQIFACVTDTSLSYNDRELIKLYLNASETERIVMDAVFTNLTGHDMDELLELAMKECEQGIEKDDPELD